MGLGRDDELDLIKQVVSLEVMSGQIMLMLKEIKEDTKSLRLEYQNYRKDMDARLNNVERFQSDLEKSNIFNRVKRLEDKANTITIGWRGLVVIIGLGWAIFIDDIKGFFH